MAGNPGLLDALRRLLEAAEMRVQVGGDHLADSGVTPRRDKDLLARVCWVLALFTEVFRGGLWPGSGLAALGPAPMPGELLALAPVAACEDISRLAEAAESTLLPALRVRGATPAIGPTFAGSLLIGGADADICAGGLLVDVKTSSGRRRKDGTYECVLERAILHQLLGYVLLDFDDAHRIDRLGIYAARFDYLVEWDLHELLIEVGQSGQDLAQLRRDFPGLLERLPR